MRPVLPNTSVEEVQAFRRQVQPIDMIGCTDVKMIHEKVVALANAVPVTPVVEFVPPDDLEEREAAERVIAEGTPPDRIKLDKAGYFVINIEDGVLLVEHYDYKEKLTRIIEGRDARSIYLTLIRNDWISKLDHAAYLGKELTKAELSLKYNFKYLQDGA
jgi:tetrahydromethanopterin S-methyltransferase subunit A